jgi:hypothetical protein
MWLDDPCLDQQRLPSPSESAGTRRSFLSGEFLIKPQPQHCQEPRYHENQKYFLQITYLQGIKHPFSYYALSLQ